MFLDLHTTTKREELCAIGRTISLSDAIVDAKGHYFDLKRSKTGIELTSSNDFPNKDSDAIHEKTMIKNTSVINGVMYTRTKYTYLP